MAVGTVGKKALEAINELVRRGVSPNEIYRKTGYKRGIDGNWAAPDEEKLYKVMNIQGGALKDIEELGGLPVPSIAVARRGADFENFGDISLVAGPEAFAKDPTFSADVYSPRFGSSAPVKQKVDAREIDRLREEIESQVPEALQNRVQSRFSAETIKEEGIRAISDTPAMRYKYLADKGMAPDLDQFTRKADPYEPELPDYLNEYVERPTSFRRMTGSKAFKEKAQKWMEDNPVAQEMSDWWQDGSITEEGVDMVAEMVYGQKKKKMAAEQAGTIDSGELEKFLIQATKSDPGYNEYISSIEPRLVKGKVIEKWNPDTASTKKMEYNLNNIVKLMKGNIRGGEGFSYGAGNIRAQVAPQLRGKKEIQKYRSRIVPTDEFADVKQSFDDRLSSLADSLRDNWAWGGYPSDTDIAEELVNYAKGDASAFKNLSEKQKVSISSLLGDLADAPTNYFEIKPQRAVGLEEFTGAAVPEGTPSETIELLKRYGIDVEEYSGSRGAALDALNKRRNIFFSSAPFAATGLAGLAASPDSAMAASTGTIEAPAAPWLVDAANYMRRLELPIVGRPLEGLADWAEGAAYQDPDRLKRAAIGALDLM